MYWLKIGQRSKYRKKMSGKLSKLIIRINISAKLQIKNEYKNKNIQFSKFNLKKIMNILI